MPVPDRGCAVNGKYEQVGAESRDQLREWLGLHASGSEGVWLITWKKGDDRYLPYGDIVDEALCFGWVDSQPRRVDAERSGRFLSPRRPGSSWSRANKQRVERLTAEGLMTEAGLAAVQRAKDDGSWNALNAIEDLIEPDALHAALDATPTARQQWNDFPRSTRRAILEWINASKTDGTRERRIAETVAEAAVGRRANQWRQPKSSPPRP